MCYRTLEKASNIAKKCSKTKKTLQFLLSFKWPLLEPKMIIVTLGIRNSLQKYWKSSILVFIEHAIIFSNICLQYYAILEIFFPEKYM